MDPVVQWFADFDVSQIVHPDDPYYTFNEMKIPLETIKKTAQDAVASPELWDELPPNYRSVAVSELQTVQRIINEVMPYRQDASWLASNSRGQINSLLNVYDRVYERFISPVRAYKSTNEAVRQETSSALSRLQEAISEAEQSSKQARSSAKVAGEAATRTAITSLSEYFEHTVTGYPNRDYVRLKKKYPKQWWFRAQYERSRLSQRGYLSAARVWFGLVVATTAITAGVSIWIFHDVDFEKLTPQAVLAKALILAAPAYSIRFSVRNYNANKHLATSNRHRAIIMQTLLALLAREEVSEATREKIIVEATARVFDPGDNGYLTGKDSLNGGDSVINFPFSGR